MRILCRAGGIIPAYAGSTRRARRRGIGSADHPRIRGEHRWSAPSSRALSGSSPHTRGAPPTDFRSVSGGGIIPAYAGSTAPGGRPAATTQDHPRIRGEHMEPNTDAQSEAGSSPHTRGALSGPPRGRGTCRIIPAYAGSTHDYVGQVHLGWDHPRIRGEHTATTTMRLLRIGSSPHTRGALVAHHPQVRQWGIIPAYAGSTTTLRTAPAAR